jgi:hypothetical protein
MQFSLALDWSSSSVSDHSQVGGEVSGMGTIQELGISLARDISGVGVEIHPVQHRT